MDSSMRERLINLVEQLTTSGEPSPDQKQLKELKSVCRHSEENVEYTFSLLMSQLCREHAQIRQSCVSIIRELFKRSHRFRQLLCDDFQRFMKLTVSPDVDTQLPPPYDVARIVTKETLRAIQEWERQYGNHYTQLDLGYKYLKHAKKVDFGRLTAETDAESRRQQLERDRRQRRLTRQMEAVKSEMTDTKCEIDRCIKEMDSGFELLVPKPDTIFSRTDSPMACIGHDSVTTGHDSLKSQETSESSSYEFQQEDTTKLEQLDSRRNSIALSGSCDDTSSSSSSDGEELLPGGVMDTSDDVDIDEDSLPEISGSRSCDDIDMNFLQRHGMTSHSTPLVVSLLTMSEDDGRLVVGENADTLDIITSLRDNYKLVVNKFLPMVRKWLKIIGKCDDQSILRRIIDIKELLTEAKETFEKIEFRSSEGVQPPVKLHPVESEGESDDDLLEEVPPKMGVEETVVCDIELEKALLESQRQSWIESADNSKCSQSVSADRDPTSASSQLRATKEKQESFKSSSTNCLQGSIEDEDGPSGINRATSKDREYWERKSRLLSQAPVVRYDVDIKYNWNEAGSDGPLLHRNTAGLGRVFTSPESEEAVVSETHLSDMKTRVIDFSGSFKPVKLTCCAALPTGKLCPRQDRHTCPFHGKIVPRNNEGKPVGQSEKESQHKSSELSWEDIESEVIEGTGVDLGNQRKRKSMSSKRGSKRRCDDNTTRLADIRSVPDTSRSRLAKRIFNKASQTRVAIALDSADRRRIQTRFGHQWNYRNYLS